ncbi:dienelactone hydrolase family protein [Xylariomycetidae sp. FL0641]|nr:dienelactone hydrolase family protein [Xylariomycetidae sp. FL0641]
MSCPDCFSGTVHDGKPSGTVTKLHGLDTYIAEPASGRAPKAIIVIIPDAFGWDFVNIRLIADGYARKKDYRVYAPDFMNGNSAPLWLLDSMKAVLKKGTWGDTLKKPYHVFWALYAFAAWAIPNRFGKTMPVVAGFMTALRGAEGARLPLGVAGFCWGGKHTLNLADTARYRTADGQPLLDVGFAAHPSFLALPGEAERARAPVAFAVGENDNQVSPAQAEAIRRVVEAKPPGQKGEVRVYRGYGHGFAVRVDPQNEDPAGAVEAEDQALAWFEKNFAGIEY